MLNKFLRILATLIVFGLITKLVINSRYHTFFFEDIVWAVHILMVLIVLVWNFLKDFNDFKVKGGILSFGLSFVSISFIIINTGMKISILNDFKKPTLLKVYYDGDFNGVGIDFKTDGTYIYDNSSVGISDYYYGTFQFEGNRIKMDTDAIENQKNLSVLEIREIQFNEEEPDIYLCKVDNSGEILDLVFLFRVVQDSR